MDQKSCAIVPEHKGGLNTIMSAIAEYLCEAYHFYMIAFGNFSRLSAVFFGLDVLFSCLRAVAADDSGIVDTPAVEGLRVEATSTNVTLTWPSHPRESFIVLWRSNANYRAQWIVLASQMRAAPNRNRTLFLDIGGLTRLQTNASRTNLPGLYSVYVIPDFWFNMQGVTLCGGPTLPGKDFLPFYYGIAGDGFPQPYVGLVVDGEQAGWGPKHVERVNFGTLQNPRWIHVWGFWFGTDLLADGEHTLQLSSMLSLNNFVGEWSQDICLTNKPVRIRVSVNGGKTNHYSWWDQRLGHDFKALKAEEYEKLFLQEEKTPLGVNVPSRPFACK